MQSWPRKYVSGNIGHVLIIWRHTFWTIGRRDFRIEAEECAKRHINGQQIRPRHLDEFRKNRVIHDYVASYAGRISPSA